jgi:ABC-type Fe3+-siderophore transport system permease subunit
METESSEDPPSTDIPTEELRIKSRLAANTRSRQRCGLLSPFYYILATLALMFATFYAGIMMLAQDYSGDYWHIFGWMLVGALSMFTIGRVIQLLHQIRDKSSEDLAANTRSRQRRGLLSPFYYILATLALMLVMIDFTHHMWRFMVNPLYSFFDAMSPAFSESNVGWLVGALSMFTIGRVIQLLHQIRDK